MKKIKLGIFFVLTFNILQFFPGLSFLREVWVLYVFLYIIILTVKKTLGGAEKYSPFELYILSLCFMPIYAGIMSKLEFGQPLMYGILTQRNTIIAGSAIILIRWVSINKVTLEDIEKTLCAIAWCCLVFFMLIKVTLNPARYSGLTGFVVGGNIEPYSFVFQSVFIAYAFFYYIVRGLHRKKVLDYIKSIPFFLFMFLVGGGRSMIVSIFAAIGIYVFQKFSLLRIIVWAPLVILITGLFLIGFYYFQEEYIVKFYEKLTDAITVVLTGEKTGDVSANARIDETEMAWPYIEKNWVFGNGALSHQWENGYFSKVGMFAPSDIGLLGNLFVFGVMGVFIYLLQILFAWRILNSIQKKQCSILVDTSKVFLIYFYIRSFATGAFIYSVYICVIFIAILFLAAREEEAKSKKISKLFR